MEKLLLIDGYSILNRGFYALPLLTNKDGIYTNAILGFMNIIMKVVADEKPDYIMVAMDAHAPTFRHELFKEYKGTRKGMPDELRSQLPIIREVLKAMDITVIEKPGYEADDILGTLAKKHQSLGYEVTLLSGDRDLLQISDEHIKISIPKTSGGKTETFNYYPEDVKREYGVTPLEFIDVKALQGDTSDNIPGVTKVGPKTATDLIVKYKNLEGIYENIEDQKGKLRENLENDKEQAFLSRTLARIVIDAPIEAKIGDSRCSNFLNDTSMEVLRKYALNSVITRLESLQGNEAVSEETKEVKKTEYVIISDFSEVEDYFSKLSKASEISIVYDTEKGVAFMKDGDERVTYISVEGFITYDYLSSKIQKLTSRLITYSIKDSYEMLGEYRDNFEDIELLAYLSDSLKGDYPISYIASMYCEAYYEDEKELKKDSVKYASTKCEIALNSFKVLSEKVESLGMGRLYREIEMPLSYVLYMMEKEGVLVDENALRKFSQELSVQISELEKKIYELSGEEFNINSPKQLGEILFEKLKLPYGKKTKTGYSTAADVLEKLSAESEVVKYILEYRGLTKLKSTYADGLTQFIDKTGRIHTHFNQTITATGRISSTEPNLQNIPIRTELGSELRKVFYPKDGCVFIDADYSQIELRLMAHMSEDEKLIDAYRSNKDIHRSTASKVFHVPFDEVTDIQRRNAKAVNFGIIYGISSYGLSQDLSISMSEAKEYISEYFEEFPKVKAFMDKLVSDARESGYAKTLFDRIRPIPELKSSNFMQRSFGERVAMNAPIQGTAADIMKIAMIKIFNRLKEENLKSKLIIQVHDEVLLEACEDEKEAVKKIVIESMKNAADLLVSLEVDCNEGKNWKEAH